MTTWWQGGFQAQPWHRWKVEGSSLDRPRSKCKKGTIVPKPLEAFKSRSQSSFPLPPAAGTKETLYSSLQQLPCTIMQLFETDQQILWCSEELSDLENVDVQLERNCEVLLYQTTSNLTPSIPQVQKLINKNSNRTKAWQINLSHFSKAN